MAHPRQLIREAAKTALVNTTAANERVVTTRRIPWRPGLLPGIGVYTLEEFVDPESARTAPRELERHPSLVVEAVLRDDVENIDDALDAIALQIEIAIAADDTLGGTASDCWLTKTEFEFGMQGDQEIAVARLIFSVTYYKAAPDAADVALDDLKTIDAKYNLANAQAAGNQAEDTLEDLDA
jgi:hypothetical protein